MLNAKKTMATLKRPPAWARDPVGGFAWWARARCEAIRDGALSRDDGDAPKRWRGSSCDEYIAGDLVPSRPGVAARRPPKDFPPQVRAAAARRGRGGAPRGPARAARRLRRPTAPARAPTKHRQVVVDVGVHNGADTAAYLRGAARDGIF